MEVHDKVMQYLALWESRLPDSSAFKDRARRAEYYGIRGATLKRIALREYRDGQNEKQKGDETLMRSLSSYRKAMDEWATDRDKYHWVATQALALLAALGQEPDPVVFDMAYKFAERDLSDLDGETRAWAHGTLAELELIRGFHKRSKDGPGNEATKEKIKMHCTELLALRGPHSFEVGSTRRQFQRYVDFWPNFAESAQVAVNILHSAAEKESNLPTYAKDSQ